jgi:murein DD-endopeptidase MepM/ murein hydrolase activator NlpD
VPESDRVVLALPFRGRWIVQNSPARRVPSHGTHLFATTYAIDFVAVQGRRTSPDRDWRTLLSTEPPERFFAFDRPILAPANGRVVAVHDGEPDHSARRSQLALLSYALTQGSRVRAGAAAIAGNHVIVELQVSGAFAVLAHLRAGSVQVRPGDAVSTGDVLGRCGNSGNSTQPHLHIQLMDAPDPFTAGGVPMAFGPYRVWARRGGTQSLVARGIPGEAEVVEAI